MSKRKVHYVIRRMNSKWGIFVQPECEEIAMRFDSPYGTTDLSAVTCLRCQRTNAFREAKEKEKRG